MRHGRSSSPSPFSTALHLNTTITAVAAVTGHTYVRMMYDYCLDTSTTGCQYSRTINIDGITPAQQLLYEYIMVYTRPESTVRLR